MLLVLLVLLVLMVLLVLLVLLLLVWPLLLRVILLVVSCGCGVECR